MSSVETHIPEQTIGAQSNTTSEHSFTNEAEAREFFNNVVKERFLAVWRWQEWAGVGFAKFALTDAEGNEVQRLPKQGDYFKIDIPGPGCATGDGFDWVRIEAIEEQCSDAEDSMLIQVRPAPNPQNRDESVAHFFTDEATSNFLIKRIGNTVSAGVHGRNEKPNVEAETILDKARNAAVATTAVVGFSKLQWKALVNGFVAKEN